MGSGGVMVEVPDGDEVSWVTEVLGEGAVLRLGEACMETEGCKENKLTVGSCDM